MTFKIAKETFASAREFAQQGYRCGTESPSRARRRELMGSFQTNKLMMAAAPFAATVPVRFVIIYPDTGEPDYVVTDAALAEQMTILNQDFAPAGIRFDLAEREIITHPDWHYVGYNTLEARQMAEALGRHQDETLNVFLCTCDMLGWASFPYDFAAYGQEDGIVIAPKSLPGGARPYDLGKTLVHEAGHWCGLYHTFEGGCEGDGDYVLDTPNSAKAATGTLEQNAGLDTCPNSPGLDPIRNFMNYTDDAAMSEFTPGQVDLMQWALAKYRPKLLFQP
jgi:hypothetical protein